jgi:hypothetical protein
MLEAGAIPILPIIAAPKSVRISPNRLLATITSKMCGRSTKNAANASIWKDAVSIFG